MDNNAVSNNEFKVGSSYTNRRGTYVVKEIREDTLLVQYTDGENAELNTNIQKKIMLNMQAQRSYPIDKLNAYLREKMIQSMRTQRSYSNNEELIEVAAQQSAADHQRTEWTKEEDKIIKRLMTEGKLHMLYYMAPICHIPSILLKGIYSRNQAVSKSLINTDHSDQEVQARRHSGKIGTRLTIHDCVPLYFTFNTPMRAVYLFGTAESAPRMRLDELAFIEINPEKLFREIRLFFTDGNAAAGKSNFFKEIFDLDRLNWEAICYRGYNENQNEFEEIKKGRQAEVLVPNHIPKKFFNRVAVCSKNVKQKIELEYDTLLQEELDKDLYNEPVSIDIVSYYFGR